MKQNKLLLASAMLATLLFASCGGGKKQGNGLTENISGNMEAYESSSVNALEQARPSVMVLPSDQVLQNFGCLKTQTANGRNYIIRDYQKYLLKDDRAKRIISVIQDEFNKQGYPLNDLEQTLKQLTTQEALDMADNLEQDAKTLLLATAQPDIVLELNYDTSRDKMSLTGHNYNQKGDKNINYTFNAIDAYTAKTVATISANNIKGESTTETINAHIKKNMRKFQADIMAYFSDILTRGRDITVRIVVAQGCNVKLTDESIEGDTYADWIMDYIKTHTVKGAYKLVNNTDNELSFTNCRIRLLNEDGTQYGVYDWTRDLARNLRTNLGLKVTNQAQGLGQVQLVINNQ